ncbi:FliM/FliN family flagellar motor switch protein [Dyella choica]|uniref:Flagellar motor switch protein FliN-like C-terminal domain-containing protein n=1 Tax=Dyella choica TaxID=1927959 RepID=A0A3S0RIW0_9GAMM|nr:FliM/FliN family flagellar motor switch protein [Dyella choica]RUL72720.1 hypothetical protein EKH80_16925 [Dyella choica]
MTQDVRFGWLGKSRREALQTLLAGLVEDWARNWWIGSAEGAIEVHANATDLNRDPGPMHWVSTGDAGTLAIYSGGKDFDAIGRFLVGANPTTDADTDLARGLGEDALLDLSSRVQRRAGVTKTVKLCEERAPLSVEHARLGAFRVTAMVGRWSLDLAIDRNLADRLVPPPAIARQPGLVHRQDAVQNAPLRVTAVMDFGSVDLAHLSDLGVGEVLVGDRKLDEPLQIHLQGHGAIAAGFLRRAGEKRAVMLDGHT